MVQQGATWVSAYSPASVAQAPWCREKVKEKKDSHRGGGGGPKGWRGGGPATTHPRPCSTPELAGGRSRRQRVQEFWGPAAGNPRPLCGPRGGAGNRVQRLVATCPRSHSKAGSRGTVNVQSAHSENPSSPASLEGFYAGNGSGDPGAGLLCPAHRGPGAAAGRAGGKGSVCRDTGTEKRRSEQASARPDAG